MKIYFDHKVINFTQTEPIDKTLLWRDNGEGIPRFEDMLSRMGEYSEYYIVSDDPEDAYERFSGQFDIRTAAGGAVGNPEGELLMIYRNGRWDLPKGHLEEGESLEENAVREVEEETSLKGVVIDGFINMTHHIYPLDERWVLKQTYWYRMSYTGREMPQPQIEEGITDAAWLSGDALREALASTYLTIKEVVREWHNQTNKI